MFVYKRWEIFCKELKKRGIQTVSAEDVISKNINKKFVILKHDVETNPQKALKMAKIEYKYDLKGSYYVQAYILKNKKNIKILKEIQQLGHEVSYHHDVMDSNNGDINKAENEFNENIYLFNQNGFNIKTVCQHGNPIINRVGYHSNRDFFRDKNISNKYEDITEIMVNFKDRIGKEYQYISDAGYGWKIISDPENNDIINSEDKDVRLEVLENVLDEIDKCDRIIISTHPHRWQNNEFNAKMKDSIFTLIKKLAKLGLKIPLTKKIMEKFYFLAKKI